MRLFHEINI